MKLNDSGIPAALAAAEADIVHIDMGSEGAQEDVDFRFVVGVRDTAHLAIVLRNLSRTASVMRAERRKVAVPHYAGGASS